LQQRRADLRSLAIEQQQLLAGTMDELHSVNRAIKAYSKRGVVPVILGSGPRMTARVCGDPR
jgi:hypothetical protein